MARLGLMQGRALPMVGERVQVFPKERWREEFPLAEALRFSAIELTIEIDSYHDHPLRTVEGRAELVALSERHQVAISSLCCDVFMSWPILSPDPEVRNRALEALETLIKDAGALTLSSIEIPMLGENSLSNQDSFDQFLATIRQVNSISRDLGVELLLETDLDSSQFTRLLRESDGMVRVNYDMGNSAYFGFDASEELSSYAGEVGNVHVKDCTPSDYSVPLGQGRVEFDVVLKALEEVGFDGDFILQTYRKPGADPVTELSAYRDFIQPLLVKHGFLS